MSAPSASTPVRRSSAQVKLELVKRQGDPRDPALDGLRGCAALMVVVVHCFLGPSQFAPGTGSAYVVRLLSPLWVGVELFFVLSGYLIVSLLLRAKASPGFFSDFYRRRFFRIVPLYALVLLIGAVMAEVMLVPGAASGWVDLLQNQYEGWMLLSLTHNFALAAAGNWGVSGAWLSVTWSLCVEEHFYLLMPLLVWLLSVRAVRLLALAVVLASPLLRWLMLSFTDLPPLGAYVATPLHLDALCAGTWLACVAHHAQDWRLWRRRARRWSWLLGPLALLSWALTAQFLPTATGKFPLASAFGYFIPALLFAWVLLLALDPRSLRLKRLLSIAPLRRLGTSAYGLYLFHLPVLWTLHLSLLGRSPSNTDAAGWLVSIAAIALSISLAQFSWHLFEAPLVAWARHSGRGGLQPEMTQPALTNAR